MPVGVGGRAKISLYLHHHILPRNGKGQLGKTGKEWLNVLLSWLLFHIHLLDDCFSTP